MRLRRPTRHRRRPTAARSRPIEVPGRRAVGAVASRRGSCRRAGEFVCGLRSGRTCAWTGCRLQRGYRAHSTSLYTDEVALDEPGAHLRAGAQAAAGPRSGLRGHDYLGRPLCDPYQPVDAAAVAGRRSTAYEHDLLLRVAAEARAQRSTGWPIVAVAASGQRSVRRRRPCRGGRRTAVRAPRPRRRGGVAQPGTVPGTCRLRRQLDPASRVSVVLPAREPGARLGERRWFVLEAVRSVLAHAGHAQVRGRRRAPPGHSSTRASRSCVALRPASPLARLHRVAGRAEMCNRGVLCETPRSSSCWTSTPRSAPRTSCVDSRTPSGRGSD